MDHVRSGGNGYNGDMTASYHNRSIRGGRLSGYGRNYNNNGFPYPRGHNDMEHRIHLLEQEAYISVLRAFKAQSNDLTWEKEGVITSLRKELRVSDDEHRELLNKANADDVLRMIREWRRAGGPQTGYDSLGSPTFSGSRKRQKTFQLPLVNPRTVVGPTSSCFGSKGSRVPTSVPNRTHSGLNMEGVACNPLVKKKVWLKWPMDGTFYEGVITDYNPAEGTHAVVYNINTGHEEWEWVKLNEIAADDIRWEAPEIEKQPTSQTHTLRENTVLTNNKPGHENMPDEIEIRNTESLIKEVETIFASTRVDPCEIGRAKKMLREQEESLIDAIAKLTAVSGGENEEGNAALKNQSWIRQNPIAA